MSAFLHRINSEVVNKMIQKFLSTINQNDSNISNSPTYCVDVQVDVAHFIGPEDLKICWYCA